MDKNTLYQQIKIQELPQIQNEVLDYFETNPNVLDGYGDDFFIHVPLDSLPVAKSFLLPRAQLEVNEVSVYFIPPNHKTKIHIDGLRKDNGKVPSDMCIAHQYVLIIPIENSTDSINYWYSNDSVPDDMENIHYYERAQFPYKFFVSFVKDGCEPEPIGSIVMDQPAFIKSNIYHRVDNSSNNKTRKVLVIRFREREYYDTLDSVFDWRDLNG
tara:strand:- start:2690 stop:3328 length:639 start_codon:yes stop_codon:yes gene_type:complete